MVLLNKWFPSRLETGLDSAAGKGGEGKEADSAHVTLAGLLDCRGAVHGWEGREPASLLLTSPSGGQEATAVYGRATGHDRGALVGHGDDGTLEPCKWKRKPPGLTRSSEVTASGLRAF